MYFLTTYPVILTAMKKCYLIAGLFATSSIMACNSGSDAPQKPKPGAIVASAEIPIVEDNLNHATFSVKVAADSNAQPGVYTVMAASGANTAKGQFTLPKKGEDYPIAMRKGDAAYCYVIGFKIPDDTTFYDYFEVRSKNDTIKMRYLKSYSFE